MYGVVSSFAETCTEPIQDAIRDALDACELEWQRADEVASARGHPHRAESKQAPAGGTVKQRKRRRARQRRMSHSVLPWPSQHYREAVACARRARLVFKFAGVREYLRSPGRTVAGTEAAQAALEVNSGALVRMVALTHGEAARREVSVALSRGERRALRRSLALPMQVKVRVRRRGRGRGGIARGGQEQVQPPALPLPLPHTSKTDTREEKKEEEGE